MNGQNAKYTGRADTSGLPALLTIRQVADVLIVDPKTVRRRIADGTLTAVRVGPRTIRVPVESVMKVAEPA